MVSHSRQRYVGATVIQINEIMKINNTNVIIPVVPYNISIHTG